MNRSHTNRAEILLSVVIPYSNSDHSAQAMLEGVVEAVAPLVADYEIIVVDNGSSDAQFSEYINLLDAQGLANIQVYRLLSKVENEVAAWAGVENSLGDYILVHDPRCEDLSRLGDALEAVAIGVEVIFLRNLANTDFGIVQKLLGPAYRWAFRHLTGLDLVLEATPGRLISKRVVSFLLMQSNPGIQYRTFPARAGFMKTSLTYTGKISAEARRGSITKIRSAMKLLISSSMIPLRLVSVATLAGGLLNLVYSVYVVVIALLKPDVAPGWTTLSLQQSGMFFLISTILFVLTEYLIHVLRWQAHGPEYFVDSERTSAMLSRRHRLNVEHAITRSGAADG